MLAVGRGLMLKPRLLMLDEPSLGRASVMCDVTFEKVAEIHKMGTAILLVEQNVSRALTLVQRPSRTSPCRASPCRPGDPLARPHQGRGGAGERRARPARRRSRRARSPRPATRSPAGEHDDQFPIDVFQTGSGTSSNMNANEVIAALAGEGGPPERPRQHGPVLQRRVPDRRAPGRARRGRARAAARARAARAARSTRKATEFADVVKTGRTHLMDAVPVTLGQEFGGYAAQIRLGHRAHRGRAAAGRARSRSAARRPAPA